MLLGDGTNADSVGYDPVHVHDERFPLSYARAGGEAESARAGVVAVRGGELRAAGAARAGDKVEGATPAPAHTHTSLPAVPSIPLSASQHNTSRPSLAKWYLDLCGVGVAPSCRRSRLELLVVPCKDIDRGNE